jgi:hypothetical protein
MPAQAERRERRVARRRRSPARTTERRCLIDFARSVRPAGAERDVVRERHERGFVKPDGAGDGGLGPRHFRCSTPDPAHLALVSRASSMLTGTLDRDDSTFAYGPSRAP